LKIIYDGNLDIRISTVATTSYLTKLSSSPANVCKQDWVLDSVFASDTRNFQLLLKNQGSGLNNEFKAKVESLSANLKDDIAW